MINSISSYFKSLTKNKTLQSDRIIPLLDSQIAFIGCSPRSGSTLLSRILDSHSKISSPCEIGIPKYFRNDKKESKIENKYEQICKYYQIDFQTAKEEPRLLMGAISKKEHKEYVVIKEPRQSLFLQEVEKDFSNIKYVHLVRDVRSIAMSSMFSEKPEEGFYIWQEYNESIINLTAKILPERSFIIRYEDIVIKPEECIAKLVKFLGYEFELPMLSYSDFEHADEAMKLWDGSSPNNSKLHYSLREKEISPDILELRKNYSSEVLSLYKHLPGIRELNHELGYLD